VTCKGSIRLRHHHRHRPGSPCIMPQLSTLIATPAAASDAAPGAAVRCCCCCTSPVSVSKPGHDPSNLDVCDAWAHMGRRSHTDACMLRAAKSDGMGVLMACVRGCVLQRWVMIQSVWVFLGCQGVQAGGDQGARAFLGCQGVQAGGALRCSGAHWADGVGSGVRSGSRREVPPAAPGAEG